MTTTGPITPSESPTAPRVRPDPTGAMSPASRRAAMAYQPDWQVQLLYISDGTVQLQRLARGIPVQGSARQVGIADASAALDAMLEDAAREIPARRRVDRVWPSDQDQDAIAREFLVRGLATGEMKLTTYADKTAALTHGAIHTGGWLEELPQRVAEVMAKLNAAVPADALTPRLTGEHLTISPSGDGTFLLGDGSGIQKPIDTPDVPRVLPTVLLAMREPARRDVAEARIGPAVTTPAPTAQADSPTSTTLLP